MPVSKGIGNHDVSTAGQQKQGERKCSTRAWWSGKIRFCGGDVLELALRADDAALAVAVDRPAVQLGNSDISDSILESSTLSVKWS